MTAVVHRGLGDAEAVGPEAVTEAIEEADGTVEGTRGPVVALKDMEDAVGVVGFPGPAEDLPPVAGAAVLCVAATAVGNPSPEVTAVDG